MSAPDLVGLASALSQLAAVARREGRDGDAAAAATGALLGLSTALADIVALLEERQRSKLEAVSKVNADGTINTVTFRWVPTPTKDFFKEVDK
jgi:hypothetical protein